MNAIAFALYSSISWSVLIHAAAAGKHTTHTKPSPPSLLQSRALFSFLAERSTHQPLMSLTGSLHWQHPTTPACARRRHSAAGAAAAAVRWRGSSRKLSPLAASAPAQLASDAPSSSAPSTHRPPIMVNSCALLLLPTRRRRRCPPQRCCCGARPCSPGSRPCRRGTS